MAYTTINKSTDYFNTKLYTGNGGGSGSSTGIGFQPDWIWSKSRTEALNHTMFDSVRGAGSNKELTPNTTSAEGGANSAGFGYISAFNSDGYSWTAGSTNTENFNKSSQTYANWCWLAGGAGSANTDGSISSTVSANTTSGFSIVSYSGNSTSGATVGHSLGTTPSTIIVKVLNEGTYNWNVYHKSLGATKALKLNLTNAEQVTSARWNDTEPTSSVFSLGNAGEVNETGKNYIAYCFAEKKGFSKFGSYTGNGNADGTFVYTGFKPAFIMIKRTDTADNWKMIDNRRIGYNGGTYFLDANRSVAEETTVPAYFDILSNGFKARNSWTPINASGGSYIYMAFAAAPLVGTNNVPANAR